MSEELVTRFYTAFAASDGEAMAECYHPEIVFSDPVFGELRGRDAGDMWRMLCGNSVDLTVRHTIEDVSAERAVTSWVADYSFGKAARPVTNRVRSTMRFAEDQIVEHHDTFNFSKWAGQALGLPGVLFGWAPPFRSKVNSTVLATLRSYQKRNS